MALVAGSTAALAALMNPVVNKVFVARQADKLWWVGGAVMVTFVLKSLASYGQDVILAYVGQRVIADLQNRLFGHLIEQDVALFQSRHSGTLVSHFTYDINVMRSAVSNALVGIGRDSLTVLFLVGVMFKEDWRLSLVTLIVAPLTILPINQMARRLRKVSTGIQAEMGMLTTSLSQSFQGIRVIKSFAMEAAERSRTGRVIERLYRMNFRSARIGAAVQPIIDLFGGAVAAALIIYDGSRVIAGTTTAGAFFSFIAAVLLAYQPLRALGKVVPNLQDGLAAADRVFALLDRGSAIVDRADAVALPRAPSGISFEDVGFAYEADERVLDRLNFKAEGGRVTALVGSSGGGKSTVLNLIPRFYDPQRGTVRIGGNDLRLLTLASLRDAIAMVGQDTILFDDTILANIRYGRPAATDDEVLAAAAAAAADEFIQALPEGYRTIVGERGLRLSGGQRQRIAIARALLKDAPILLLDEATSALDSESERQIQQALVRLMAGRTTLVIAHRLSTIRNADMIHVMERGQVVESGTHDELIARRGGRYAQLHALQFAAEPAEV